MAALFGRLDEVVYRGSELTIELKSTVVADHGPNTAESIWGADFGIVASIHSRVEQIEKAVIGQAKRGSLPNLSRAEAEMFRTQVIKMSHATDATIGLEVPAQAGISPLVRLVEVPMMYDGVPIGKNWSLNFDYLLSPENEGDIPIRIGKALPLGEYLYAQVLRCFHGDSNSGLIRSLDDSSLTTLRIEARR